MITKKGLFGVVAKVISICVVCSIMIPGHTYSQETKIQVSVTTLATEVVSDSDDFKAKCIF